MNTVGQWFLQLAMAVESRSGPRVVESLRPNIQLKGKDRIDQEPLPQEFMQAKRHLNQMGIAEEQADWEAF